MTVDRTRLDRTRAVRVLAHRWFGAARDAVFVFAATVTIFTISDGYPTPEVFALAAINTALVFSWCLAADVYDVSRPRVATPPTARLVRGLVWVLLTYLAVHFVTNGEPERRTIVFAWSAAAGALVLGYVLRGIALLWFQRRGALRERLLIVGGGDQAMMVASQIARERRLSVELVGALDEFSPRSSRLGPLEVLGDPLDLEAIADRTRASAVVVVANAISWEAQEHVIQVAANRPSLRVFMVAGVSDLLSSEVLPAGDGLPALVRLRPAQLRWGDALAKRTMDLTVGALLLPALGAVMLVALLSGGAPRTRTVRVLGRGGRPVDMRLLAPGAGDGLRARLAAGRAGKLPALAAVLRGDLSLVGPRPMVLEDPAALGAGLPADDERDARAQRRRMLLLMAPGLTGPWDNDAPGGDGSLDDLTYIRTYTPWSDLRLMVTSVRRMMMRERGVPATRPRHEESGARSAVRGVRSEQPGESG